jgi:DNA (cytosine-5)-methyltransferase 1
MTVTDGLDDGRFPSELAHVDASEWETHSDFVIRNIEMVTDILAGELKAKQYRFPVGCPRSTPASLSRQRSKSGSDDKFSCCCSNITAVHSEETVDCQCGDPLCGSDSILDAVAAVSIADSDRSIEERYFDHRWRQIIARLREEVKQWETIANIIQPGIHDLMEKYSDGLGVDSERPERLLELLSAVEKYDRTPGVTLEGLPAMPYETLASELASFPGVSESDAWWLLLTAFEKPVWPASQEMNRALVSLGLLQPGEIATGELRQKEFEKKVSDRRLPALHRVLAGHLVVFSHDIDHNECELRKFTLPFRQRCQEEAAETAGPVAVDLFSGAGGLSHGFDRAGFSVEYATDHNQAATDTYRLNHPEIPHEKVVTADISELADRDAFADLDLDVDIVIGGPPCQAISNAGYRSRLAEDGDYSVLEDSRTQLYQQYIRAVRSLDPDIILMENVEGMINEVGDTGICVSDLVLESLDEEGYDADYQLVDCSSFGIPQRRKRVFILGINRTGDAVADSVETVFEQILEQRSQESYTLRQGLAGLPHLLRGEGGRVTVGKRRGPRGTYLDENDLENESRLVFNHQARDHPKEKDRKLFDIALDPGQTSWDVVQNSEYDHLVDYDLGSKDNPRFTDKYRMLDWESEAPTVVAHLQKDANNFIIPDYHDYYSTGTDPDNSRNRGITPREAARIQSFPDEFIFLGPFTQWFVQIGNAVPPVAAEHIANILYNNIVAQQSPADAERASTSCSASSDD